MYGSGQWCRPNCQTFCSIQSMKGWERMETLGNFFPLLMKHGILKWNLLKATFAATHLGGCDHGDVLGGEENCVANRRTSCNIWRDYYYLFFLPTAGKPAHLHCTIQSVWEQWVQLIVGLQSQRAVTTMYAFSTAELVIGVEVKGGMCSIYEKCGTTCI